MNPKERKIKHVITDSDFGYVLRDNTSKAILFIGMVRDI